MSEMSGFLDVAVQPGCFLAQNGVLHRGESAPSANCKHELLCAGNQHRESQSGIKEDRGRPVSSG